MEKLTGAIIAKRAVVDFPGLAHHSGVDRMLFGTEATGSGTA
ncbi:MAG TPA: hypothetical protein VGW77_12690 [Candidatus Binatia bacterium]|nr:hypothetical protein [Candidatus Binatia bacterium]